MKTLPAVAAVVLALSRAALAAEIADLPWTESNLDMLRALDKAAVVNFVNRVSGNEDPGDAATTDDIGEFAWADLTGHGRYELLVTVAGSRAFYNSLAIYRQDSSGKVSFQNLAGWMISDLGKVVRDLDGDRRKELVIPIQFPPGAYWDTKPFSTPCYFASALFSGVTSTANRFTEIAPSLATTGASC
ncbi:MAG: hypothetical protein ACREQF_04380 [Candidatus Binataceae bacterium]